MSDMKKKESDITKADDIKSTEPGGKKAGRPAKQKVIKSPVKNEAAEPKPAEKLVPYCPCNDYLEDELSIECESCQKYWHLCCVGLCGLSADMVNAIENWECPDCYKCVYSYRKKPELNAAH